ncbi:acylphosphatase [Actinomyces oricola]|uniref:acylphosphatase n=1 Tax=Actinomyces oricola TaxID=206043 RepID=UPI000FFE6B42|nr:acylphosphatase [Actinomyces oricola]
MSSHKDVRAPRIRTIHAVVSGMVQGVGFRYHCTTQAQTLGLIGEVRNLYNGDVEVMAQGRADAVAQFIAWLYRGPRWAQVDTVRVTEMRSGSLKGRSFTITG